MTVTSDYQKISPTAKLVAEMRRYSDIAFAEEIAKTLDTAQTVKEILGGEPFAKEVLQWMAPLAEARYKSLLQAVRKSAGKQILEFASGFCFRGAVLAKDPSLRYVETDLPEVHEERLKMRHHLEAQGSLPPRPQLVFAPANLMSESEVEKAVEGFDETKPLTILHEGLFQYFSLDEKKEAARVIGKLLKRFGGVWMTPDFETKEDKLKLQWTHPQFRVLFLSLVASTQRYLLDTAFENDDHVISFFSDLGFTVTKTPQIDSQFQLSSAASVGTTSEQLEALRASRHLWVLRLE